MSCCTQDKVSEAPNLPLRLPSKSLFSLYHPIPKEKRGGGL